MELNLADLFESVVDTVPDRTAVLSGDRRLTYASLDERANRLAQVLSQAGVGADDFVGIQLPNGSEYLEVMIAAFKLRAVPVNVNYRYVDAELQHLYADAGLVALVHHVDFANAVGGAVDSMAERRAVLSVGTGGDYEEAISSVEPLGEYPPRSADDLYCVYTGGTTGLPKGVLWRQEDIFFAAMGGGDPYQFGMHIGAAEELAERIPDTGLVAIPAPPFMHAAAHWLAFAMLFGGGTIVTLPSGHFDARTTLELVEKERANILVVVGDAMARPLIDVLEDDPDAYDLSSLMALGSGGALLSPSTKSRLRALKPDLIVRDSFGSSETGQIGGAPPADDPDGSPRLQLDDRTTVLDDDLHPVAPGSGVVGRLARGGRVPLRYLGDPDKSAATFVSVDGTRWALPGDLATIEGDGTIVVLGRSSQCINTGGEKVYPEEVEGALKAHPDVVDVVVVGIPDENWGQAVCAVVQQRPGSTLTLEDLRESAGLRIARYKLPRHLVFVGQVERSPAGKPDQRWAAAVAADATAVTGP
ncbi:MAG: acyl-CoA synthetase [Microthrixaceae bacterium]